MAQGRAVLHVLDGPAREQAHVRAALATIGTPRASTTRASAGLARAQASRAPSSKARDTAEVARLVGRAAAAHARVLHCHGAGSAWHASKAALCVAGRFAVSVQGRDVLIRDDVRVKAALHRAHLVVVPSQFLADAVLARRVRHERVYVLPPGVPLGPEPQPRHNLTPVVVFTGAFDEQSGVLDVAEAVKGQPVLARFVGSGPLEAELRARGLAVTVTDAPDVQRGALDSADLAIAAGRSTQEGDAEAWGRTAVEAQAAGVPVIATRNGGLAQWVDPEGAVLVPSHGDVVRSLRAALEDLLARPGDWAGMGRSGRAHVRAHLDVVRRTAELEQLWRQLGRGKLRGALIRPPDQF